MARHVRALACVAALLCVLAGSGYSRADSYPVANTPEAFGARIKAEIAKWSKVVHDANIRAD